MTRSKIKRDRKLQIKQFKLKREAESRRVKYPFSTSTTYTYAEAPRRTIGHVVLNNSMLRSDVVLTANTEWAATAYYTGTGLSSTDE